MAFGMMVAIFAMNSKVMAQDAEITDEDLTKYAQVTMKIDAMKADMKDKITTAVKSNELLDGGRLYNKLNKAKEDETKIAETGATEEQLAAYAAIKEEIKVFKADFKMAYTTIVKEEIGAGSFNKVKKGLKTDDALKLKYDQILVSLAPTEDEASGE